ncbi:MAG: hypothetical protein K8R88_09975 [Armatimonadetes bacterium]|nr:hypothetical protein [Armatimonadota bacterium]
MVSNLYVNLYYCVNGQPQSDFAISPEIALPGVKVTEQPKRETLDITSEQVMDVEFWRPRAKEAVAVVLTQGLYKSEAFHVTTPEELSEKVNSWHQKEYSSERVQLTCREV